MQRILTIFMVFWAPLALVSCVSNRKSESTVVIEQVKDPLNAIMKSAAYALPGGISGSSTNRRVFKSRYVSLTGDRWDVLSKSRNRAFIEIGILGDRRPYIVEISAIVEERSSSNPLDQSFKEVGQSRQLAERIATKFINHLEDRRKRRNLIDEFRAF